VLDLSATPFFLSGSGYAEGTLFPWTMSDFSLMDAIESGIVKLPRVPVADNIPGEDAPVFRDLWEHIRKDMPKKGRGKTSGLDPLKLPSKLQTALEALYGHYEKTFELWTGAGISTPPCFIVVCNNTSTSKLVYDYISGFHQENDDGSTLTLDPGMIGPSHTLNVGIIGESVDLTLEHTRDLRKSTILFHLTRHLLYSKWRDAGDEPELHLFGQLKSITRQWLDHHLVCKGDTYSAQLLYREFADIACEKITAAITRAHASDKPIHAILDPTIPPAPHATSASTPPRPIAGRPTRGAATSTGWSRTVTGKPNSAAWPRGIRASAPTSRTTASASKCRTRWAPSPAATAPTSSSASMTGMARTTSSVSWSRSKASAGKTRR